MLKSGRYISTGRYHFVSGYFLAAKIKDKKESAQTVTNPGFSVFNHVLIKRNMMMINKLISTAVIVRRINFFIGFYFLIFKVTS